MISILIAMGLLVSQLPDEGIPQLDQGTTQDVVTESATGGALVGEEPPTPTIRLVQGFSHIMKIPMLKRAIIGNNDVAVVDIISPDELLIIPKKTGATNLIIKTRDGLESEFMLVVDPTSVVLGSKRTIGVKVYVVEILKSARNDLGIQWVDALNLQEDPIPIPGLTEVGPIKRFTPISMTLRALVEQGKARILSAPTLITLEGKPATFFVGGQIPVVTAGALGSVSTDWKSYGVSLKITPTVDLQNYIVLSIQPDVSDLDWANAVQTQGYAIPAVREKKLNATVRVRSGETVGLGGLINTKTSIKKTGIPILSSLPLLGSLFSVRTKVTENSEIIFLVTPMILPKSLSLVEVWSKYDSKTYELPLLLREETVLVPIDELAKIMGCRVKKGENEVQFKYRGKTIRINYDTQSMMIGQQLNEIYVENYFGNLMVELKVFKQIFSDVEIMWDKYENVLHIIKDVKKKM